MKNINFKLAGLTCDACVAIASNRLKKTHGVTDVSIDLSSGSVTVLGEENVGLDALVKSLEGTHYSIIK